MRFNWRLMIRWGRFLSQQKKNWEADYTVFETNMYQTGGYISSDNVPYSIDFALPFRAE